MVSGVFSPAVHGRAGLTGGVAAVATAKGKTEAISPDRCVQRTAKRTPNGTVAFEARNPSRLRGGANRVALRLHSWRSRAGAHSGARFVRAGGRIPARRWCHCGRRRRGWNRDRTRLRGLFVSSPGCDRMRRCSFYQDRLPARRGALASESRHAFGPVGAERRPVLKFRG